MKELVFFLEEESAKYLLQALLPRMVVQSIPIRYIVFEGKQDLERQLERKLRSYQNPDARFIVLRDKDSSDCFAVKSRLKGICSSAGKPGAIVRIACHEMESWYLADLEATGLAYGKSLAHLQSQQKFRSPDSLGNPVQELRRIVPEYQKVDGARRIGAYLDIHNQRSRSFYHLTKSIIQEAS